MGQKGREKARASPASGPVPSSTSYAVGIHALPSPHGACWSCCAASQPISGPGAFLAPNRTPAVILNLFMPEPAAEDPRQNPVVCGAGTPLCGRQGLGHKQSIWGAPDSIEVDERDMHHNASIPVSMGHGGRCTNGFSGDCLAEPCLWARGLLLRRVVRRH
jgi:hypothetical protein